MAQTAQSGYAGADMRLGAGQLEKRTAALSSIAAAVGLTGLKIIIGLWSGSLGILAEAAHSGMDLLGSLVTYIAVRLSGKPADSDHPYGHGKAEHLSALFETVLLLLTCAWIIRESVDRLAAQRVLVDASVWTFTVMAVSIAVDVVRSRLLFRIAAKHRSQALEADALHFQTDMWSSAVVILGLAGVRIATWFPGLGFLQKADAVAALLVAGLVTVVSVRLGIRTIEGLMDTSPSGAAEQIKAKVETIREVMDCHAVRVRHSGPNYFVDLHVTLDGRQPLQDAHAVTERVEQMVSEVLPGADVTVHPEPTAASDDPSHGPGPQAPA
jgi:cation diffusion facilitator family transporter